MAATAMIAFQAATTNAYQKEEEELLFSVDIAQACAESRALPARRQSSDIQHCS